MSNQNKKNKNKKWYLKNVIVLLLLERHVKGWVPMYVDKNWLKVDDLHHCQNVQKLFSFLKYRNNL
jgi:hypothetical protein